MSAWLEASKVYLDRRVIAVLFLGFSSGLPFLLVFSTLSFWLKAEGVSLAAIGLFSLVRTPYTFKFLWAPLVDHVPVPVLSRVLGRRRGWTIVTQVALMGAVFGLGSTNPGVAPFETALLALLVAFCSATQDIMIDAYRIEILEENEQGAGAAVLVAGYRVGLLTAGFGALQLSTMFAWPEVYMIMAALVTVGIVTVLVSPEPQVAEGSGVAGAGGRHVPRDIHAGAPGSATHALRWLQKAIVAPFKDFMRRDGWAVILLFIMLYKLGDAYLGVMANPFYVEMGFSAQEIANVSKIFGLAATVVGGIIGGLFIRQIGILRSLLIFGVLQMLSNLVFAVQAAVGHNVGMLVVTIGVENITGGMATAAFVAYLSSLCNVAYTATQYALLSSFMAFARDVLSASSGVLAEQVGWVGFFVVTTIVAVPGLLVLLWLMRS
ncbi:MAG: AmpG family muropeptide MFS transporter, partial [Gemmatimonadales bacterium]